MYRVIIIIRFLVFQLLILQAQNSVSIGTDEINPNAVLQLVSPGNNQGFLVTRLTTVQREAMNLTDEDDGMMVFDITEGQFFFWYSDSWIALSNPAVTSNNFWSLGGNTGTDPSVQYLGTSDDQDVIIKTDSEQRILINGNDGNVAIGNNIPSEKLDVDGSITLRGATSEYYYTENKNKVITYPAAALSFDASITYITTTTGLIAVEPQSGEDGYLPVILDDNCLITDIKVRLSENDSDPGDDIYIDFYENNTALLSAFSDGSGEHTVSLTPASPIEFHSEWNYILKFRFEAGNNIIYYVQVSYLKDKAD